MTKRSEHVLFTRDARSACRRPERISGSVPIVAAMPERAIEEARATAEKVRLLVQPAPDPDAEIAETIWRAVRDNEVLRIRYIDLGGLETERGVEPQHVVPTPIVDGHQTKLPESALRPENLLTNSDIGLSPDPETVGASRPSGG